MKRIVACSVVLFVFVIAGGKAWSECKEPAKTQFKPGMKVIAALAGPNWAVAKIESVGKKDIMVKYADGGMGSLGKSEIAVHPDASYHGSHPCFAAGDKVIAKAAGDTWRTATISSIKGENAEVTFADKKKKTLKQSEIVRQPK